MENKSSGSLSHSKFLLPVLGLSIIATWLITIIFELFMVDIATGFGVQVGTASMAASVGSISGIIFGLLMAVVSIRFNHKLLLLSGLVLTNLGTLGYYFSPNFFFLLASNIGVGAGIAVVTAMAYSIVGDVYPLEKRGKAVGALVASTTLAIVIGSIGGGVLASYGDWHMITIVFSLPISLISLALAALVIPKNPSANVPLEREPFSVGCKQAFSNISRVAALLVTMFLLCESAIVYYSVSFFRDQFGLTVAWGSTFLLVGNLVSAVGGIAAGFMVNRVGRKRLGTISFGVACVLTLMFTFMPTAELSGAIGFVRFWFSSMAMTAGGSLIIELLPKFRSTMMSLNTAFMNVGILVASLIAGFLLNSYGYQAVGLVLGSLGLVGAIIWITLVKEPCTTSKKEKAN